MVARKLGNKVAQVKEIVNSFAEYMSRAEDYSQRFPATVFCKSILTQVGNISSAIRKRETMEMITFYKGDLSRWRDIGNVQFQRIPFPMVNNHENALFQMCSFSMVRWGIGKWKAEEQKVEAVFLQETERNRVLHHGSDSSYFLVCSVNLFRNPFPEWFFIFSGKSGKCLNSKYSVLSSPGNHSNQ